MSDNTRIERIVITEITGGKSCYIHPMNILDALNDDGSEMLIHKESLSQEEYDNLPEFEGF